MRIEGSNHTDGGTQPSGSRGSTMRIEGSNDADRGVQPCSFSRIRTPRCGDFDGNKGSEAASELTVPIKVARTCLLGLHTNFFSIRMRRGFVNHDASHGKLRFAGLILVSEKTNLGGRFWDRKTRFK